MNSFLFASRVLTSSLVFCLICGSVAATDVSVGAPLQDAFGVTCQLVRPASERNTADGQLGLTISGGRPPYVISYTSAGGERGDSTVLENNVLVEGLPPGRYEFTVVDADSVRTPTCLIILPFSPPLLLNCLLRNNTDGGRVLGAITASVGGGLAPYRLSVLRLADSSFIFQDSIVSGEAIIDSIAEGNYELLLVDDHGDSLRCQQEIIAELCPLRVVSITTEREDCSEINDLTFNITLAGVLGTPTTRWRGGPGVEQFNDQLTGGPLAPGNYFVDVSDESGCPAVVSEEVEIAAFDTTVIFAGSFLENRPCSRQGRINLILLDGPGPFTVQVLTENGDSVIQTVRDARQGNTVSFRDLPADPGAITYRVEITDRYGCIGSPRFFTLSGGGPKVLSLPPADQTLIAPACQGDASGVIELAATGGRAPYQYEWRATPPLPAGRILTPGARQEMLPAGRYVINITDANGCTGSGEVTLTDGESPQLICGAVVPVTNAAAGSAGVTISGANGPFTIHLTGDGSPITLVDRPEGQNNIPSLSPGAYTISVTDANGCRSDSCTITVADARCAFAVTSTVEPIGCGTAPRGEIRFDQLDGTPPYSFNWATDVANDSSTLIVNAPGEYAVTITDANGCQTDTSALVEVIDDSPQLVVADPPHLSFCVGQQVAIPLICSGRGDYRIAYRTEDNDGNTVTDTFFTDLAVDTLRFVPSVPREGRISFFLSAISNIDGCRTPIGQQLFLLPTLPDTIRILDTICGGEARLIGGQVFDPQNPSDTFDVSGFDDCITHYEVDLTYLLNAEGLVRRTDTLCDPTPLTIGGRSFSPANPRDTFFVATEGICGTRYEVDLTYLLNAERLVRRTDTLCDPTPLTIGGRSFGPANPSDTFIVASEGICGTRYEVDLTYLLNAEGLVRRTDTLCDPTPLTIGGRSFSPANPHDTFFVATEGICGTRYEVDLTYLLNAERLVRRTDTLCDPTPLTIGGRSFGPANPRDTFFVASEGICGTRYEVDLTYLLNAERLVRRTDTLCAPTPLTIGGRSFGPANPSDTFFVASEGICGTRYEVALTYLLNAERLVRRTDTLCDPTPLTIGGRSFSPANPSDTFFVATESTCGTRYEVDLTYLLNAERLVHRTDTLCDPTPLTIGGRSFNPANPSDTFFVATESTCGTRYEVNLTYLLNAERLVRRTDTLCDPTPLTIGGRSFGPANPSDTFFVASEGVCGTRYEVALTFLLNAERLVRRTDTLCDPTPLTIGGRNFSPANPNDTFFVATEGICGTRYEVDLFFPPDGIIDTLRFFPQICQDSSLVIEGRTFTPTAPSDTFLVLLPSGCSRRYEVMVNYEITIDSIVVQTCAGVPFELNGERFDGDRPSGIVAFVRGGRCDSLVHVSLDIISPETATYNDTRCGGDTVRIGDRIFTAADPGGLARLAGAARGGCDSLVMVSIDFRPASTVELSGADTYCRGDSVLLRLVHNDANRLSLRISDDLGNSFALSNVGQDTTFAVLPLSATTTYQVTEAVSGGCEVLMSGTASPRMNDLAALTTIVTDPAQFCSDTLGAASVAVTGGVPPYAIRWADGNEDALNALLTPGTQTVSVEDAEGCRWQDSVLISPANQLEVRLEGVAADCPEGRGSVRIDTVIGDSDAVLVSLADAFFVPISSVGSLTPAVGENVAIIEGPSGCRTSVSFWVPPPPTAADILPADTIIRLGEQLLLSPDLSFPADTAFWTPPNGLSTPESLQTMASPLLSTTYTLHLRTAAGCELSDQIRIFVNRQVDVYLPTAFSPNNDGVNDVYTLGMGPGVESITGLQIFNRWGALVHEGSTEWDGSINGQPAPAGAYVFKASIELTGGETKLVSGDFFLTR